MSNARFHEKSQNSVRLQFFTVSPTDYLAALGDPGKGVLLGSSQNKLGLQIFTVSATDYLTA
ncbi:MAG: hypothetical protein ABF293_11615, partial [Flavobacteriaceae bacterium]